MSCPKPDGNTPPKQNDLVITIESILDLIEQQQQRGNRILIPIEEHYDPRWAVNKITDHAMAVHFDKLVKAAPDVDLFSLHKQVHEAAERRYREIFPMTYRMRLLVANLLLDYLQGAPKDEMERDFERYGVSTKEREELFRLLSEAKNNPDKIAAITNEVEKRNNAFILYYHSHSEDSFPPPEFRLSELKSLLAYRYPKLGRMMRELLDGADDIPSLYSEEELNELDKPVLDEYKTILHAEELLHNVREINDLLDVRFFYDAPPFLRIPSRYLNKLKFVFVHDGEANPDDVYMLYANGTIYKFDIELGEDYSGGVKYTVVRKKIKRDELLERLKRNYGRMES